MFSVEYREWVHSDWIITLSNCFGIPYERVHTKIKCARSIVFGSKCLYLAYESVYLGTLM